MTEPARTPSKILFHYHPWSRAAGVRWLLEELEVPYDVHFVDPTAPGGAPERYRAIHPHKKVPAIEIDGQIITERAAITIYLADRFSAGKLAPSLDDARRAAYLKMLVYNDAVLVTVRRRRLASGLRSGPWTGQELVELACGVVCDAGQDVGQVYPSARAVGDSVIACR